MWLTWILIKVFSFLNADAKCWLRMAVNRLWFIRFDALKGVKIYIICLSYDNFHCVDLRDFALMIGEFEKLKFEAKFVKIDWV